jgi:hypothetical protein
MINYKNKMVYLFIIVIIILFFIKKFAGLNFGEIFNPNLKKIESKINKFVEKDFNINLTYLYFKGNSADIKRNIEVFKEIIDYLDDKYEDESNIYKRGKVSIKLRQMGNTDEECMKNFSDVSSYAFSKNIFIWISAFHYKEIKTEYLTYLNLKERGFSNIGITIACYHYEVDNYVNLILNKKGNIRLVKGYYNDGQIKDWSRVTKNYLNNAKKIIRDSNYHQLATHDFKNVLNPLNNIQNLNQLDNIEIGFFVNSMKHLTTEMKKYKLDIKNKCVFLVFGKKFKYLKSNIYSLSLQRLLQRLLRVKNIV